MLHELFLALSGHNSSLFDIVQKLEDHLNTYNAKYNFNNPDLSSEHHKDVMPFKESSYFTCGNVIGVDSVFHPCELKMISEILEVAKHYMKVQNFYAKISGKTVSVSKNEKKELSGYYLSAFATAVYEETNSFQKSVVKLEEEYLKSSSLLLSTIMIKMNTYKYLFCELCRLINIVESKKLHGCKLLDFLHKEVILSVGELEVVLKRIRNSVQKVLIEQLTYWLIYGELLDPHEELFLKVTRTPIKEKKDTQKCEIETVEVSISMEMLPEFIPLSVAEKIVFIGEHILSFERGEHQPRQDCGLILREKEKELIKDFQMISETESFAIKEFQNLVETVRLCVSQYIYNLVTNAGLLEELSLMKDIFLMGRGELYQAFFILSGNKRPCNTNINSLFQRAGRQILMEENILDKFIVTYQETKLSKEEEVSVWSNLRIEYLSKWPLHKFFNSSIQDKYNTILHFLLQVRETQLRLQDLFVTQKNSKAFRSHNLSLLCWTLRHHMSLMICNLQYYIQVDVLESQFSELQNNINNVKDYQRICFHHQSFLSSVITQCFLCHPIISTFISSILEIVKKFCDILEGSQSPLRSEVECVKEDFDKAASKLFWALKTLGQSKNTRLTTPLILKIDYNKFYSSKSDSVALY